MDSRTVVCHDDTSIEAGVVDISETQCPLFQCVHIEIFQTGARQCNVSEIMTGERYSISEDAISFIFVFLVSPFISPNSKVRVRPGECGFPAVECERSSNKPQKCVHTEILRSMCMYCKSFEGLAPAFLLNRIWIELFHFLSICKPFYSKNAILCICLLEDIWIFSTYEYTVCGLCSH